MCLLRRAVEALGSTSIYRFCVWRDPVRRLASAYWEKIHEKAGPGAGVAAVAAR